MKLLLIFLIFAVQFDLLAPSLTENLAKVPYRQHERFEAEMAYAKDKTAENKAAFEMENRKVIDYVTHQKLVNIVIPFAALLLFEGVVFYYFLWHKETSKA